MTPAFDYQKLAARQGISPEQLAELESVIRRQYGHDEMMIELRILRTLRAIEEGALTLDAAVVEFRGEVSSPAARTA